MVSTKIICKVLKISELKDISRNISKSELRVLIINRVKKGEIISNVTDLKALLGEPSDELFRTWRGDRFSPVITEETEETGGYPTEEYSLSDLYLHDWYYVWEP